MVIGELIHKLTILISMTVDPHGRLVPFMMRFLYGTSPKPITFWANCLNTEKMYMRITTAPCPSGIILQAAENWKRDKTTWFFRGYHTAPIPQEYTMQQLGLTLTKTHVLHLWKAIRHMGVKPHKRSAAVAAPPGFESIEASDINGVVDIQRVAFA